MENFQYLIIGGGMAADAAVKGIREIDKKGKIGLISMEEEPPYDRPPLSKGLWKETPFEKIWRHTEDQHVTLYLGRTIDSLDAEQMIAVDDQGASYHGDKILLATGGTPRELHFGQNIIYYRTLESYRRLAMLSEESSEDKVFAVIGGGFIGAEIAAALCMNGKKVTMLMPEEGIVSRIFPHDLSQYLNQFYRSKGVEVLTGEKVTGVTAREGRQYLQVSDGPEVAADYLVAGIGIELNVELAQEAGLRTDRGILVNEYLQTSKPNIFAAGDAAVYFSPALDKWMNFEHEDNANMTGRTAGRNMAGAQEKFDHLSYFYSDLFELGYEAVGDLDSRLVTVADWAEPFKKGVIYYFKDERICGVLLWNVWDKVPVARELIKSTGPYHADELKKTPAPSWKISF